MIAQTEFMDTVGHYHAVATPNTSGYTQIHPITHIDLSERVDELEKGLREALNMLQGTVLNHWDCDCSVCAAFRVGKEALDA